MVFGGCGWTSFANVNLMVHPYLKFIKSSPNSASAADYAKTFKIVQRVNIAPLSVMGYPHLGYEPRNKWPDSLL